MRRRVVAGRRRGERRACVLAGLRQRGHELRLGRTGSAGRALLGKFPDGDRAVEWILGELGGKGVDFEDDVKPALGPETDFVALDVTGEGKVVGLTQPDDGAKLDALLAKSDEPLVSREIDGWVAFSDSEANLDEFERLQADGTLEEDGDYQKVSGEVADDGIATVYVAGSALDSTPLAGLFGSDTPSLALSLDPQEDGIHLEGAASPATGDLFSDEFSAELPGQVPGGAFLYAGANDLERQLGTLRDVLAEVAPGIERDIGRAEAQIGVSLDEDVFPLFSAESALYLRPGFPIPEVTIVTQVDDEQGALAVLDKLAGEVAEYYGTADLESVDIDGVQAKELAVNQFFSVYYAAFDGKLVITTSRRGDRGPAGRRRPARRRRGVQGRDRSGRDAGRDDGLPLRRPRSGAAPSCPGSWASAARPPPTGSTGTSSPCSRSSSTASATATSPGSSDCFRFSSLFGSWRASFSSRPSR